MDMRVSMLIALLAAWCSATKVYEANLRNFDPTLFSNFLDNPPSLTTQGVREDGHHGVELRLEPFVDNEFYLGLFRRLQFFYMTLDQFPISTPVFTGEWLLSAKIDTDWSVTPIWHDAVSHKNDDPRLGTAAALLIDTDTGIFAAFFLTDCGVWAYYERLPIVLSADTYLSFGQIRRVASRSTGDVHHLSISYTPDDNALTWAVDHKTVTTLTGVGKPAASGWHTIYTFDTGEPVEVRPATFQIGFGAYVLMDVADPWTSYSTGLISAMAQDTTIYSYPRTWESQTYAPSLASYSDWVYGQSIKMKLFEMEVHLRSHLPHYHQSD